MDATLAIGLAPAAFDSDSQDEPEQLLSYDETVPYEDQVQPEILSSLADRIGKGRVYLLADAAGTGSGERTTGKKKLAGESVADDVDMEDLDPQVRSNALLFSGPPIAHLPTQRIFAYATHFEAHPLGLEWISDTTCVLVFSSRSSAQTAYKLLQRSLHEEPFDDDGSVSAKAIPVPLWPAQKQLSRTLEKALGKTPAPDQKTQNRKRQEEGLSGPLRMRWARVDDVKKKGASKESEFYKKHGTLAGKEAVNGRDIPNLISGSRKRGREDEDDADAQRARLDQELEDFLDDKFDALADRISAADQELVEEETTASKMRSDYIATDGRTAIHKSPQRRPRQERRRRGRGRTREDLGGPSLSERMGRLATSSDREDLSWGRETKRRRGDGRRGQRDSGAPSTSDSTRRGRNERPKKTQQELDDELDAFLNGSGP